MNYELWPRGLSSNWNCWTSCMIYRTILFKNTNYSWLYHITKHADVMAWQEHKVSWIFNIGHLTFERLMSKIEYPAYLTFPTLSTLLAICEGNPPATGGFPTLNASIAELWSFIVTWASYKLPWCRGGYVICFFANHYVSCRMLI